MKRFVLLALVLASCCASAQVTKCTLPNGKVTYGDGPCPVGAADARVNTTANVVDGSSERAAASRMRQGPAIDEREANDPAAFHPSGGANESQRRQALKAATTPYPGSQGGLTKAQRESAASLSRTQQERDQLMREANTPLPGSRGGALTASQLDAQRRLSAANRGEPMPPPVVQPDPPHPRPEPTAIITSCDPGGCWDDSGRRLIGTGGATFQRSDGKTCNRAGANVFCN